MATSRLEIEPGEPGSGLVFENKIVGGSIPGEYIPSVRQGVVEAMASGVLAGYPIEALKVTLYDGSYHRGPTLQKSPLKWPVQWPSETAPGGPTPVS